MSYYHRTYGKIPKVEEVGVEKIPVPVPEPPVKKTDILYHDLSQKEQYWRRDPRCDNYKGLDIESLNRFIKQEWDRRKRGVWMYVKGKPTYITGAHYFYLNWVRLDEGIYPEYRDRDRRWFIFWEMVDKDPNCLGFLYLKNRREGATSKVLNGVMLEKLTRTKDGYGGIQTHKEKFAKGLLKRYKKSQNRLPEFFLPVIRGDVWGDQPVRYWPPQRSGKNQEKFTKEEEALFTTLDARSPDATSYDGERLNIYIYDEGGKVKKPYDVAETWRVVRETMKVGPRVVGKALFPTTVEEMESKGGKEFKVLWDHSDYWEKSENGRTLSELYRLFFPSYDGLPMFIGKYGESIIEGATAEQVNFLKKKHPGDAHLFKVGGGAKTYLLAQREHARKHPGELASLKRKFPFTIDEAFRSEAKDCLFNGEILERQEEMLNQYPPQLNRGDLKYQNESAPPGPSNPVSFYPNKNGRFVFSEIPPQELLNNIRVVSSGALGPMNRTRYAIGMDPIDSDKTHEGKWSDAAMYGFKLFDPRIDSEEKIKEEWNSHQFFVQYLCRPPKASTVDEDALKLAMFLGAPILIENNKKGTIRYFQRMGCGAFLVNRPHELRTTDHTRNKNEVGAAGSGLLHNVLVRHWTDYIQDHGMRIPFIELVKQLKTFDPTKPTQYDAFFGGGLAIVAATDLPVRRMQNAAEPVKLFETFRRYAG